MFGLFGRKDPICGMKETKGAGIEKHNKWFCSNDCLGKYESEVGAEKKHEMNEKKGGHGCCH